VRINLSNLRRQTRSSYICALNFKESRACEGSMRAKTPQNTKPLTRLFKMRKGSISSRHSISSESCEDTSSPYQFPIKPLSRKESSPPISDTSPYLQPISDAPAVRKFSAKEIPTKGLADSSHFHAAFPVLSHLKFKTRITRVKNWLKSLYVPFLELFLCREGFIARPNDCVLRLYLQIRLSTLNGIVLKGLKRQLRFHLFQMELISS
jgi:hypothetical protein